MRVAAAAACLLLIAALISVLLFLTWRSLEELRSVPPLSLEAAALAWSYAVAFTAAVVLLLALMAAALALAELAAGGREEVYAASLLRARTAVRTQLQPRPPTTRPHRASTEG